MNNFATVTCARTPSNCADPSARGIVSPCVEVLQDVTKWCKQWNASTVIKWN